MRTSAGFFMPEKSRTYSKLPLSYEDLITRFTSRGLLVKDEERAKLYLQNISYFRFTGYGLAFEEYSSTGERLHKFKKGTSFDDLLRVYIIDRKIRLLIIDAIERIEVAVRSTINHEMACHYNNSHWYLDKALFLDSDQFKYADFIREIKNHTACNAQPASDREQRREQFINHYYFQYDKPELPPCWMIAEVLPLGSWSKIYSHLRVSKDKKRISTKFDVPPATLESWLHALTYLRNLCAHHSRLYYRPLVITPKQDHRIPFDHVNRFASFAAVIVWFLQKTSPNSSWLDRLLDILSELPPEEQIHYGFKDDWWAKMIELDS